MADRLSRGWLWFVALMAAPILLLSFRTFPAVTSAYAVPALIGLAVAPSISRPPGWVIALGLLVAYALVTVIWTPQSGIDWVWWQPTLFLVGFFAFQRSPPPVHMLTIGLSLALVLLVIDAVSGSGLRAIIPPDNRPDKDAVATARGLGILLMMMPFLVLAIARKLKRRWALAAALSFVFASLFLPVEANVLAALVGLGAGGLAYWRPGLALKGGVATVGGMLASPFVLALVIPPVSALATWTGIPTSSLHRLIIWRTVLDDWLAGQPLFGAGARATRALGREAGRIELPAHGVEISLVSVHPHSVPIEILYEYGLLGYGLLLAAFVGGARALLSASWSREAAAAIASLIGIIAVIFSLQTTMWNVYFTSATLLTVYALYGLFGKRT